MGADNPIEIYEIICSKCLKNYVPIVILEAAGDFRPYPLGEVGKNGPICDRCSSISS